MAKIVLNGYTSIPATRMKIGNTYRWWLHNTPCTEDNALSVRLDKEPGCAIRDMGDGDKFVGTVLDADGNDTDRKISLVRNSGYPFFLVTAVAGRKEGTMTTTRLSILKKDD